MSLLFSFLRSSFIARRSLVFENLALRRQLAAYKRTCKRRRLRMIDRAFWVGLSKLYADWQSALIVVKPQTVIGWHRQGFKLLWRWRSRPGRLGRPTIPREHIEFIRRMSRDNPTWGEDKIDEELRVKFGIGHSTSTIRKHMVRGRSPDGGQRSNIVQVSAGYWTTCAGTAAGAVYCWGYNAQGMLGDDSVTQRTSPVSAVGLP